MVGEVRLDPPDDLFGEGPDVILFFTFESINSFTVYLPDFFPILEALNCVIPSFPSLVLLIWRQILTSQFLVSSTPVVLPAVGSAATILGLSVRDKTAAFCFSCGVFKVFLSRILPCHSETNNNPDSG